MIGWLTRGGRVRRHYEDLMRQWDPLVDLAGDETAFAASDETVSVWSVGQQLEHVARADEAIFGGIVQLLDSPDAEARGKPSRMGRAVMLLGRIPRGKGRSPEPFLSTGLDAAEVRGRLAACRRSWRDFESRLDGLPDALARRPHPVLGAFDACQWLRFEQIHLRHHRAIIDDILGSAG